MRIAIANDRDKQIAAHTGRCPRFLIYDVTEGKIEEERPRDNPMALNECGDHSHQHDHGHSHHSHDSLMATLADCQILLCRGMGPRLVADLAAVGIEGLICNEESAEEALRKLVAGELKVVKTSQCQHG